LAPSALRAVELKDICAKNWTILPAKNIHVRSHGDRSMGFASFGQWGHSAPHVSRGRVLLRARQTGATTVLTASYVQLPSNHTSTKTTARSAHGRHRASLPK
jgi:hypothetical protein